MRAQRLSIAAVVAGAVAVAGCGGDESDGARGAKTGVERPAAGRAATVELSETEFEITPADPSVDRTGPVTFVASNDGQLVHALEVEGQGEERRTAGISPGQTASLKVELSRPGRYELYCPIGDHRQRGMRGELKVGGGGGSASDENEDDSESGGGGPGY